MTSQKLQELLDNCIGVYDIVVYNKTTNCHSELIEIHADPANDLLIFVTRDIKEEK